MFTVFEYDISRNLKFVHKFIFQDEIPVIHPHKINMLYDKKYLIMHFYSAVLEAAVPFLTR